MVYGKVKLDIKNIKNFVNSATKEEFDIDVSRGRYVIDGKSILGLYSLDLSKELELRLNCRLEEASRFLASIKEVLTEEPVEK